MGFAEWRVLEAFNGPRAKEFLMVYNFYLKFCCFALLKADSHILFAVVDVGGLADVLMSTVVDIK